jgi:hypothetical protein
VKDEKNKWLEAQILEVVPGDSIKIHYKGWSSKFDEYIPISIGHQHLIDTKYAEIGLYSQA